MLGDEKRRNFPVNQGKREGKDTSGRTYYYLGVQCVPSERGITYSSQRPRGDVRAERTFYSVATFAPSAVSKRPGSPQSVIILATIKNVQTRRQRGRVRSALASTSTSILLWFSTQRSVFCALMDTRIIILLHGRRNILSSRSGRTNWCIVKLDTRVVLSRLNWSLFLSPSRLLRGASRIRLPMTVENAETG